MDSQSRTELTQVLDAIDHGDSAAEDRLMPLVYDDMRALAGDYMKREAPWHTLQPTALVNEAFLELVGQQRVEWKGRSHFFAIGAQIMRRILVDHARAKKRAKRGGDRERIELTEECQVARRPDIDLLEIDDALAKLAKRDARQAKIVELRFFGGLTVEEVAGVLGMSKRSVEAEWTMIRAWLRRELADEE